MNKNREEEILALDLMHKVEHVMLLDVIRNQKVIMDALQAIIYNTSDRGTSSSLDDRIKKCNIRYPDV